MATPSFGSPAEAMEGELGHHSPAGSSCVSSDVFGSPIPASPREKLLDSSPSSCVSDDRSKGGRPSSPTRGAPKLDSPSSCVSDGRYASPLRVSAEHESEVREAERLLRAIAERYDDCFLRLRDAAADVADLRRERLHLRAENMQLSLLLEELEAKGKQAYAVAPAPPPKPAEEAAPRGGAPKSISIRSKGYHAQMKQPKGEAEAQRLRVRPLPAIEVAGEDEAQGDGEVEVEAAARGGTPKSISIRSKGYLSQMKQPKGEAEAQRLRVRPPPAIEVAGEDEAQGDGEVEVEAYRQGTQKTELCNKWEGGACPYADRCRFAHGLQEMRPVVRHPRYKTLPCQMFAAASGCPYGHRCHFRHSPAPATESY
ncbi:unnamed protein product [Alopecurus aequalis]